MNKDTDSVFCLKHLFTSLSYVTPCNAINTFIILSTTAVSCHFNLHCGPSTVLANPSPQASESVSARRQK